MKEKRVIRWFLLFIASILFLGQLWEISFWFSKMNRFQKMHIEKLILLFDLLLWNLSNKIYI